MSLVPRESLLAILNSVYDGKNMASNRLTLAIPIQDLLSYYDSKLIREVLTADQGLLLTLAIPLASSQTAFKVYESNLIPMPQKGQEEALQWLTERKYLAVPEHFNCLGSSRYGICHQTIETNFAQSSSLDTLFFSFGYNTFNSLRYTKSTPTSTGKSKKSWVRYMVPHISVTGIYTRGKQCQQF